MLKSQTAGQWFLAVIVLAMGGCSLDAPHDNPLDPDSPQYTGEGNFAGRTLLSNSPSTGVPSVRIATIPSTVVILTDSLGSFQFPPVRAGSYDVVASKELFTSDTVRVTVVAGRQQAIAFSLNGFPEIGSTKILTRKIDQWWPNPAYFAEISAAVADPNGIADIDSVWLQVDSLLYTMAYSITDKTFQLTLTSYQLPSNNLEWLVGKPLSVRARDRAGASGVSAPFYVTRLIEQEAIPQYPKFQDTTSASPVFQWTPPDVRFVYTYSLNVVRVDAGTTVTIWTKDNIGNHLLSYGYPFVLTKGNYFWTIAIVDEYGNYARSKESSFVVN